MHCVAIPSILSSSAQLDIAYCWVALSNYGHNHCSGSHTIRLSPVIETGFIVRQQFMNARLCSWFCFYNSAYTNIFIRSLTRCDHNTKNSVKKKSRSTCNGFLAVRSAITAAAELFVYVVEILNVGLPCQKWIWSSLSQMETTIISQQLLNFSLRATTSSDTSTVITVLSFTQQNLQRIRSVVRFFYELLLIVGLLLIHSLQFVEAPKFGREMSSTRHRTM